MKTLSTPRGLVVLALFGLATGCNNSSGKCVTSGDCNATQLCVDGVCTTSGTGGGAAGGSGGGSGGGTAGGTGGGATGGGTGGGGGTNDGGPSDAGTGDGGLLVGGETCATATVVHAGSYASTTVGAANDVSGDCTGGPNPGPDRVFAVDVGPGERLSVTVTPTLAIGTALQYDPSLYLIEAPAAACGDADAGTSCLTGSDSTTALEVAETVSYANTSGSTKTIFIVVDSFWSAPTPAQGATSEGTFTLDVGFGPVPAGDTCGNATPLTAGTMTGETTIGFSDDYRTDASNACVTGTFGPDHAYSLTVPAGKRATVTVTPQGTFDPSVNLIDSPAATCDLKPRVCLAGTNVSGSPDVARWFNASASARQIFAVVDSTAGSAGNYSISVGFDDLPPGEVCDSSAPLLAPDAGLDAPLVAQDLAFYGNDFENTSMSCQGGDGPDRVYRIDVPAGRQLLVTATPDGGVDVSISLTASSASCSSDACLAGADSALEGGPETLVWTNKGATTQSTFVVIDSFGTGGLFDVVASLRAPPPGDTCQNAEPLTSGASPMFGQTTDYSDDYETGANAIGCSSSTFGPDHAYSLVVPPGQRGHVTVSPDGGFDPNLSLVAAPAATCDATPRVCVAGVNNGGSGEPESISVMNTGATAQTFFAIVDSTIGSWGEYTISFSAAVPPADDTCSTATTTLTSSPLGGQSLVGFESDYGMSDVAAGCVAYPGEDRVYVVALDAGAQLKATLNPTSVDGGFDSVLNVIAGPAAACDANRVCGGASNAGGAGEAESVSYLNQTSGAQTVYVVVSSLVAGAPDTSFSIQATTSPPPAGETCLNAISISASTSVPGSLVGASREYAFLDASCKAYRGPERVYAVTLQNNQTLSAMVTPANNTDVVLELLDGPASTCSNSNAACLQSADDFGHGTAEQLMFKNTSGAAKTVFLLVAAYDPEATMPYTLDAQLQ